MNPREKADIVDRLRNGITEGSNLRWTVTDIHLEAATEIASLRQELAELREDKRIVDELLDAAIRDLAGEKADGPR